jgi:hypothetical protein
VEEHLYRFDARVAMDREAKAWDCNPLFHYCAMNPHIQKRLPVLPWKHSKEEAERVVSALEERTRRIPTPREAMFLKCYLMARGELYR